MRSGRAFRQFPFVAEQVREEVVAPLGRCRGPNDFQTAADRIAAFARFEFALPAKALFLDTGGFRLCADQFRIASAVGFAERVTPGNERNGLLVIHRHTGESLSDIPGRGNRVRLAVRPFRIDVDQTHLHRSERILRITVAAVALVREPLALRSPEDVLFRFPDVLAPAAKTERLKAHRLERDVASENHEVGPGDFPPILLLDGPEQPARLVEVDVVRPAIERREALLTGSGPAAAVADTVRARAVPRHTNEKRPIVAKVG